MRKILSLCLIFVLLTSCNEYNKILKSTDYEAKYEYAKQQYEAKNYARASALLEELVLVFRGTDKAEESLDLLCKSYFMNGDYTSASQYFNLYYSTYPKGKYAEQARFLSGKSYFLNTPEAKLDQTGTYKAINELQQFIEYYPLSQKKGEAEEMLLELQEKLVQKELLNVRLYFNLGSYMHANNYLSAIITAQNVLREYPFTKYREELSMLMLRSRYLMAAESVAEKQAERFRETVDEYYSFINDFPESKYLKEATRIFNASSKKIKD